MLTRDRNTPTREGAILSLPVAAGAKIFAGALVAVLVASGYATPGATATTLKAAGRADEFVDNTSGANGDVYIRVRRGVFFLKNSAADPISESLVLSNCYIEDDETVAATDGVGTRSIAGKVIEVESNGVWVEIL